MKNIILAVLVIVVLASPAFAQELNISEQASNSLTAGEIIFKEIKDAGFGTSFFNDVLLDAKSEFENADYGLVLDKIDEMSSRREQAFKINDSIGVLEIRAAELNRNGLDVSKAVELLDLSKSVFKKEAFEDAEALILRAEKELDEAEAKSTTLNIMVTSAKDNLISYVRDNFALLLLEAFILAVCMFVAYFKWNYVRSCRKLDDAKLEKSIIDDLMKKNESAYFESRTIGKEEYDLVLKRYQEEFTEISGIIPVLEDAVKRAEKGFSGVLVSPYHPASKTSPKIKLLALNDGPKPLKDDLKEISERVAPAESIKPAAQESAPIELPKGADKKADLKESPKEV